MHDIKKIRDNPEAFDAGLARRGEEGWSSDLLMIDRFRREAIQAAEEAQAAANRAAKAAGAAKARKETEEFERLRALSAEKKQEKSEREEKARIEAAQLDQILMTLPNLPEEDVPDGADETANVELRRWGNPRNFSFAPKQHFEVAAAAAGFDLETAAHISGSRFMLLRGALTRLHRALAQFMIDTHVDKNGFTETWVPVLVRDEMMAGTGQLPKFEEDSYRTTNGWWLIPTAEVPLTNTVGGHILDAGALPIRLTAHTQCFRSEAGSAGKDTAGVLRQHQFEKVEMVSIVAPDQGREELDYMTRAAEGILEALELPYRTMVLSTGDMGFAAARTHDIEVWLPGQNAYREISSCSVCNDFQARRMNARYRPAPEAKPEFLCTLNGSGLAVGRALIAVIENYQQEDGAVAIPDALRAYVGGREAISPDGAFV
ncbi:MAG: serine--tRNA ligase [Pseudomonadota bacterium]